MEQFISQIIPESSYFQGEEKLILEHIFLQLSIQDSVRYYGDDQGIITGTFRYS